MDTPTITMPREVAREQLRQYRRQLHKRADSEYQAVAQGLEALAEGTPLINLADCFKNVPLDEQQRPRLAIARADRAHVNFRRESRTIGEFSSRILARGRAGDGLIFRFEVPALPQGSDPYYLSRFQGRSVVPMVPAPIREKLGPIDLSKHFVLWEVENWDEVPRDPYLLRHCGGQLYAILAEWDLTELERAVMAGRIRA